MNAVAELLASPLHVATLDDASLAAFVAEHPASTPFHDPRWGRAVEQATGHRMHILGALDAAGQLVAALPVHAIRSRLFGNSLASTGFAVDGGILAEHSHAVAVLADAVTDLARDLGIDHIELRGGAVPAGWAVDSTSRCTFSRPLAANAEAELAAIPRKHRAEVRKSLANPLAISTGRSEADRRMHYAVYAESVRNLGTPVFPRALFDAVLDAFGEDADILTIRHEGAPVASVLSLYWRGTVMPYWGGGTRAARALRANERMYFALMDHARSRGMTRFDFGRSKVGSGPAAYKKNWGFEAMPLHYARWTVDGGTLRDVNPSSKKFDFMTRFWQRMPLSLANRLGPLIARQLG
jgi:FemAB-related protein (PEP-CTERM system-associated)